MPAFLISSDSCIANKGVRRKPRRPWRFRTSYGNAKTMRAGSEWNARAPLANVLRRWPDLFQLNGLYVAVLSKLGEDLAAYQTLRHAHQLNVEDSGTADLLYSATLELARKSQGGRRYSDSFRYFEE